MKAVFAVLSLLAVWFSSLSHHVNHFDAGPADLVFKNGQHTPSAKATPG
jgi:hypothetical protein